MQVNPNPPSDSNKQLLLDPIVAHRTRVVLNADRNVDRDIDARTSVGKWILANAGLSIPKVRMDHLILHLLTLVEGVVPVDVWARVLRGHFEAD